MNYLFLSSLVSIILVIITYKLGYHRGRIYQWKLMCKYLDELKESLNKGNFLFSELQLSLQELRDCLS